MVSSEGELMVNPQMMRIPKSVYQLYLHEVERHVSHIQFVEYALDYSFPITPHFIANIASKQGGCYVVCISACKQTHRVIYESVIIHQVVYIIITILLSNEYENSSCSCVEKLTMNLDTSLLQYHQRHIYTIIILHLVKRK